MANPEHLEIINQGVKVWNDWRIQQPEIVPDLSCEIFFERNLSWIDLSNANLVEASFCWAYMRRANLSKSNLRLADFTGATLIDANLSGANLLATDLENANLAGANLSDAKMLACRVYGVSAWSLNLTGTSQQNHIITPNGDSAITVDDLEFAQFVHLLLSNEKIRGFIDTATNKVVLILGRFTDERMKILEAIKAALSHRNYVPVIFNFRSPSTRSVDETVTILARMARFVIADLTDAKSVLQEMRAIVPALPSVPFQPIILSSQHEHGMYDFYRGFRHALPIFHYADLDELLAALPAKVINPAEEKVAEMQKLIHTSTES